MNARIYFVEMLNNGMQNRRLAGPRIAGQYRKPFITLYAVDQVPKSLLMFLTPVEETRVRRNIERLFFQTVKSCIHKTILRKGLGSGTLTWHDMPGMLRQCGSIS